MYIYIYSGWDICCMFYTTRFSRYTLTHIYVSTDIVMLVIPRRIRIGKIELDRLNGRLSGRFAAAAAHTTSVQCFFCSQGTNKCWKSLNIPIQKFRFYSQSISFLLVLWLSLIIPLGLLLLVLLPLPLQLLLLVVSLLFCCAFSCGKYTANIQSKVSIFYDKRQHAIHIDAHCVFAWHCPNTSVKNGICLNLYDNTVLLLCVFTYICTQIHRHTNITSTKIIAIPTPEEGKNIQYECSGVYSM